MTDRTAIFDSVAAQIAPFNKKGIALTESTSFAGDLEWDSLTVMDFVAAIEDHHHEHAGRDRNRGPAGRRGGEAQGRLRRIIPFVLSSR